VTDAQLAAFRGMGFDDAAIIEVIAEIGLISFANLFNHVHDTPVDPPAPPLG
jgi:alkylhydroperoxidase family enzyme